MSLALFTLGGTIAMNTADPSRGVVARLTGADLTAAVPGLAEFELDIHDVEPVPSAALTFEDVVDLVERAGRAVDAGARGVVVTQGTDTLEETAYLADLLWTSDAPLVFTGAMRNPTLAGPDGPANLLAAVQVAASDDARGLGVTVAFADEVHAARWVRKTHTTSTGTFVSPNTGPIGHLVEERVRILARPQGRTAVGPVDRDLLRDSRVALWTVALDDDGGWLPDLELTYAGLVVAGYGAGHVPPDHAELLGELAMRMPVVLASRTGSGSVLSSTYGAVGSETDLLGRGLIGAGFADPYKARILLRLLLATGATRETMAQTFASRA